MPDRYRVWSHYGNIWVAEKETFPDSHHEYLNKSITKIIYVPPEHLVTNCLGQNTYL